jgi:hypothetical protein
MNNKLLLALLAIGLGGAVPTLAGEYQRSRSLHATPHPGGTPAGHFMRHGGYPRANVVGSYFQRPYPYHLDYYRMRYGGSYAPYFGNQYGVPQVYAPAYGYPPYGAGYPGSFGWPPHYAPQGAPGFVP